MRDDKFKDKTRLFQKKNQLFRLSPKNFGYSKWVKLIQATEYFKEKNVNGIIYFENKK